MITLIFKDLKQWEKTWSILYFPQTWQNISMTSMKWRNDWLQWTFNQTHQKTRRRLWIGWSIWQTFQIQQSLGRFVIVGLICSLWSSSTKVIKKKNKIFLWLSWWIEWQQTLQRLKEVLSMDWLHPLLKF